MGRKRKTVVGSTIVNEDKTSNACPGITSADEKIHVHADNTNATEAMNFDDNAQPSSNGLPANEKKSTDTNVVIRRSGRLKSSVLPSGSQGVKPFVEHVNLVDNEKEESPHSQLVKTSPVLKKKNSEVEPQVQQVTEVKERNLEEQVGYLVQEADELNSEVIRRPHEGYSPNFNYKSLYIDSQKKIEALMEANYELVKKLEFALGKVEAYEKMSIASGATKEVLLVASLGKATEATLSLSPQKVQEYIDPFAADSTPDDAADDPKQKKKDKKRKANGW